ncbi:MAG TPA: cysteine-rich CWC family protein [Chitinophagaceae bacterium]|nr:cysteine-rich CWC family protein [Chitinophagaceae bacterium]
MNKQEEKYCPKCNSLFICKMGDIANCQCTSVALTSDTINFLSKTNYDCLCKNCLAKTNSDVKAAKSYHFPAQQEMFVEGLHYYKEDGFLVFTELYHLLRGYCCKSGCRHCVYGYKIENRGHGSS